MLHHGQIVLVRCAFRAPASRVGPLQVLDLLLGPLELVLHTDVDLDVVWLRQIDRLQVAKQRVVTIDGGRRTTAHSILQESVAAGRTVKRELVISWGLLTGLPCHSIVGPCALFIAGEAPVAQVRVIRSRHEQIVRLGSHPVLHGVVRVATDRDRLVREQVMTGRHSACPRIRCFHLIDIDVELRFGAARVHQRIERHLRFTLPSQGRH